MTPATGTVRVKVVRWGNSQAVRLSKEVLQQAQLREGDELIIHAEQGRIALESAALEITLEKLVAGITPQNRHGETTWGKRVGNEVW
jgi:antitoxin MazE